MGLTPGSAEQRFPGYDVMRQQPAWDEVTTSVVTRPTRPVWPAAVLHAGGGARRPCAAGPALGPRRGTPRARVRGRRRAARRASWRRLPLRRPARRSGGMAPVRCCTRRDGSRRLRAAFEELTHRDQRDIIEGVRLCKGTWHGLPAARLFSLWMRYACSAFYAHPWAWNEIGFGGPAYPRGYKNLALGAREPWEVEERDAQDPVPWAQRAEAARKRHAAGLSSSDASRRGRTGTD